MSNKTARSQSPAVANLPLTQSEVRLILMCLMLTMFLAALDQTIVASALPTIGHQFNDVSNLSWIVSAYLLASTAVAPLFGSLSDIYGRRAMIVTSLSLFLVGSVACAMAPSMLWLIIARALQGLGGGGILPIVQTIIADIVPPRDRGQYQAYFSAVWVSAGIGGPILGGVFAEHLHWSMIFWINLPLGIVSLALLLPRMGRIPVNHRLRKVDWLGAVLLMAAALSTMLVLTWGGTRMPWLSPEILGLTGAAVVLAIGFISHARHTDEPFLPIPLISGTVVPYAIVAGGCALGAMLGLIVNIPLYYNIVYGLTASETGLALIPIAATSVIGATIAGRAMSKTGRYKRTGIIGTSIAAVIGLTLAVATPLPLWLFLVLLACFAIGLGTVFPLSVVATQNAVLHDQVGTVTGALNFFRALLSSFTVAGFSTILLLALGPAIAVGPEHHAVVGVIPAADLVAAFRAVFAAASVLLAIAALCLFWMEERPLAGAVKTVALTE